MLRSNGPYLQVRYNCSVHNIYWGIHINFTWGRKGISVSCSGNYARSGLFYFPKRTRLRINFFLHRLLRENKIQKLHLLWLASRIFEQDWRCYCRSNVDTKVRSSSTRRESVPGSRALWSPSDRLSYWLPPHTPVDEKVPTFRVLSLLL